MRFRLPHHVSPHNPPRTKRTRYSSKRSPEIHKMRRGLQVQVCLSKDIQKYWVAPSQPRRSVDGIYLGIKRGTTRTTTLQEQHCSYKTSEAMINVRTVPREKDTQPRHVFLLYNSHSPGTSCVGAGVGAGVGSRVGSGVGPGVGSAVGTGVRPGVGSAVGTGIITEVGTGVGSGVSSGVTTMVGSGVSSGVGETGTGVGTGICPEVVSMARSIRQT